MSEPTGNFLPKIKICFLFSSFLGWVVIPIKDIREHPIRTFMIQIAVISNHQNGRDTHMRQIRIHSPTNGKVEKYTSPEFNQFSTIR